MKTDYFLTFLAVLRAGSFSEAAKEIHLTPSAISTQMKALESFFGKLLFDRSSLKVQPTNFALSIKDSIQAGIDTLYAFKKENEITVSGILEVGVIESLQPGILPQLLTASRRHYPNLNLVPIRGKTTQLLDGVKAGELDAAIVVEPYQGQSKNLHWDVIRQAKLVMITPNDRGNHAKDAYFQRYDWIRYDKSTTVGRKAAEYVAKNFPSAKPIFDQQSIPTVVSLVAAGIGVSVLFLPESPFFSHAPIRIHNLGPRGPSINISLVCQKDFAESRNYQALLEMLKTITWLQQSEM